MRFWVGVTSAFGAGTLIGIGVGMLLVEDKLKKEYAESAASMRRAFEAARIDAETPVDTESELIHLSERLEEATELRSEPVEGETPLVVNDKPAINPYHAAVTSLQTEVYASFAVLDEEEYFDDDGRSKEQITMIYSDDSPIFFMNGQEIDDVMERVGGTIVDDMRNAVRDGNPTLYMRNNQTDTDYEVLFEQP